LTPLTVRPFLISKQGIIRLANIVKIDLIDKFLVVLKKFFLRKWLCQ